MKNLIAVFNWKFLLPIIVLALIGKPIWAAQNFARPSINVGKFGSQVVKPVGPILPPVTLPRISISAKNAAWVAVALRCGKGPNVISRRTGSGTYQHFRTLNNCSVQVVKDVSVEPGTSYCYRLETIFNKSSFTSSTCTKTPNKRVSFTGRGITSQESDRVLSEFDWLKTDALPEGSASQPILYYMSIFLENEPDATALRELGVHVQSSPVFIEETSAWDDGSALVVEEGEVTGRWYFAVLPGAVYNKIREQLQKSIASGAEPGLRAIVFRTIPNSAAREFTWDVHRLSYQYLGEQGFEYNAIKRCFDLNGTEVCRKQQAILGWLVRKGLHFIFDSADTLIENIRDGIGFFKRKIKGGLDLTLQFELINTDPFFGAGENQLMYSGWSGQKLYLKGTTVRIRQGFASFSGKTDEFGRVTIKIAKGSNSTVCIEAENKYVILTEFLLEKLVCVENIGKFSNDEQVTVSVKHPYFNVLAQMTDTAEYLQNVANYTMPQITVLVGSWASRIAVNDDRAFAPCMGRMPNLILGTAGDIASLIIPGGLLVSAAAEFLYAVDIVLPKSDHMSRGVGVHEYGHVVMCSMLAKESVIDFQTAWTDVILASADQHGNNDTSYIVEAFADFISSQVVGGTNYYASSDNFVKRSLNYCRATGLCMETNFTENFNTTDDKTAFTAQVRRVSTLLHDAFDGNSSQYSLNDGSHWEMRSGNTFLTQISGNNSVATESEIIELDGLNLPKLFSYWNERGNTISEESFLGGLADLLRDKGYDDFEICDLFSSHSSFGQCPEYVSDYTAIIVTPTAPPVVKTKNLIRNNFVPFSL